MRKIEPLGKRENFPASYEVRLWETVSALVDAVNKLYEWTGGFEQTQEPEMNIDFEAQKKLLEKEPKCEHGRGYASTCPICAMEKPDKKECRCDECGWTDNDHHYACGKQPKKDELAERLGNICSKIGVPGQIVTCDELADEARKWAVEVVESYKKSMADGEVNLICKHILARLKESNGSHV